MTRRNTGGILSATEQATDSNSANGIFTLSEAAALTTVGAFPVGSFAPNRSARFRSVNSTFLSRTPATAGNQQIFTESVWFKRGSLGVGQWIGLTTQNPNINYVGLFLNTSNAIDTYIHYNGSTWTGQLTTTQVFRDTSAWYHIVLAVDTTQAAAKNRIKLYVNGVQVTAFSTESYPAQNTSTLFNAADTHFIGTQSNNANYFDGYLSEMNWIDGQQLTASAFGQTDAVTGMWVPKRYSGSYGTNGFYLPFNLEDSGSLGAFFSSTYLVVGGGGGGNSGAGGGGAGGGGFVEGTLALTTGVSYSITVGAGGALDSNGGNSELAYVLGFGGGSSRANGGSGGGGGSENGSSNQGNSIQYSPLGGTGYGSAGGNKTGGGGYSNGGGGGAGGTGGNSSGFAAGGTGGAGRASSLSGSSVTYAAGGGGWGNSSSGGGGSGASGANSGRGGNSQGGTGSSGIVIVKIPDTRTATFSAGVTVSGGTASGGFKTYSVTATSTTSETVIFS